MINPVFGQTELLKEYIKTLVASGRALPGIQPRQWGKEFSKNELSAIHSCLRFLLKTAGNSPDKILIENFCKIGEPGVYLHWFVCRHWPEIVQMLTEHPTLSSRRQLSLH